MSEHMSRRRDVLALIRFRYLRTSRQSCKVPRTNLPKNGELWMTRETCIKIGRDTRPSVNHYYIIQPSVSRTQLEFYSVLFEDNPNPDEDQPPKFAADGTVRMPPPPAIYVRDRMSSNGTYVDDEHHIGNPAYATPGYLLRHGQRVSILGEGFAWVFELVQPLTADLGLPDTETCVDNEHLDRLLGYRITGHELGSGNYGCVYSAIETKTSRQVICKVMRPTKDAVSYASHQKRWLQEIDLMKQLNHYNVVSFLAAATTPTRVYCFAELASGGDLMTFLQRHAPVGEMDTRLIMRQIVRGVLYLHSRGVIHRDLKPENILFATYPKAGHRMMIADLGSAGNAHRVTRLRSFVGTVQYNAPEVVRAAIKPRSIPVTDHQTHKVDSWAVGMIALFLLVGCNPFENEPERIMDQDSVNFQVIDLVSEFGVSADGSDFIGRCLRVCPRSRLSDLDSVRHDWFNRPADDVKVFEACDREALGGWQPRRHISPMIEYFGAPARAPHLGGAAETGGSPSGA